MELEEFLKGHVDQVVRIIDTSDVFVIGFTRFAQRLLVDTRYSEKEPPLIQITEAVSSAEERLKELGRNRPSFPRPERFAFAVWPRSIKTLQEFGIWDRIRTRVRVAPHPGTDHELDVVLGMLKQIEHLETREAIAGPNRYRTLWQRQQS